MFRFNNSCPTSSADMYSNKALHPAITCYVLPRDILGQSMAIRDSPCQYGTALLHIPRAIVSKNVQSLKVREEAASVDIASSDRHTLTARVGVDGRDCFRN